MDLDECCTPRLLKIYLGLCITTLDLLITIGFTA